MILPKRSKKVLITEKYENLLLKNKKMIFIDVRSPREYNEAHIPGAVNIPLFNDSEYRATGILYKKEGKKTAIREALKIIGPKLYDIYMEYEKYYEKNSALVIYCSRGGMRSSTIASLLKELSMSVIKLESGYKGYRQYLNKALPSLVKEFEFVSLYGKTGGGKTSLLRKIEKTGYDILDLERCANNRGSLLGGIGLEKKYSQKYFESLVFDSLIKAKVRGKTKIILTEGESRRIGNIVMPSWLYDAVLSSRKLCIETGMDKRVETIKEEYIGEDYDTGEIIKAVEQLQRYIGNKRVNEYIENINKKNFDFVIQDLIENYYDKVYKSKDKEYERVFQNDNEEECIEEIIKYLFPQE